MKPLAILALLVSVSIAVAEPPPKIPLRDFFKNPVSRGYLLSPDGKTLSYLAPWETRMNIFIRPTAGGEAKRITSNKDRDIRDYFHFTCRDVQSINIEEFRIPFVHHYDDLVLRNIFEIVDKLGAHL